MRSRYKNASVFLLSALYFLALLTHPAAASEATLRRLMFFGQTVLPALFVSLCLSAFLITARPLYAWYRLPFGVELTVFLLGVFCGFPVGARSAMLLYEDGRITKRRAEFLCGFSNLASLPFLVGVVGGSLFENVNFGIRLACLQALSALATAGVLFFWLRPRCDGVAAPVCHAQKPLAQVIGSSAHTMLELGGMLLFFGVAADLTVQFLQLDGLPAMLVQGILEFSGGCAHAATIADSHLRMLGVALSVACSGLCVGAQVACVTGGKLSMRPYVVGKLAETACMAALASVFLTV